MRGTGAATDERQRINLTVIPGLTGDLLIYKAALALVAFLLRQILELQKSKCTCPFEALFRKTCSDGVCEYEAISTVDVYGGKSFY